MGWWASPFFSEHSLSPLTMGYALPSAVFQILGKVRYECVLIHYIMLNVIQVPEVCVVFLWCVVSMWNVVSGRLFEAPGLQVVERASTKAAEKEREDA